MHAIAKTQAHRDILQLSSLLPLADQDHMPVRLAVACRSFEQDFESLADSFGLDPSDRIGIKQMAAERLIAHVEATSKS